MDTTDNTKNKILSNYLHLYFGCEFISEFGKGIIVGFHNTHMPTPVYGKVYSKPITLIDFKLSEIKLILYRLSDMTEMQIIELMTIVYKSIFGYCGPISETRLVKDENDDNKIGFICRDDLGNRIGLTVEVDRGVEFSFNGEKLMVNQFECTRWLLKNNFDLFGLNESGLAVNPVDLNSISS